MKKSLRLLLIFLAPFLVAQDNTQTSKNQQTLENTVIEEVEEEPVPSDMAGSGATPPKKEGSYSSLKQNLAVLFIAFIISAFCLNQVGNNPGQPASAAD